MEGPKILIMDIENGPVLADVWALFKQYISLEQIRKDWIVMSWSAKWAGQDEIYSDTLFRHAKAYKKDPEDDSQILKTLHPMLCEADIVVGHNVSAFDLPKIRARMLLHGIQPFPPVQEIDTLKIAKQHFKFTSNKLAYIAKALGVGEKEDTGGHLLWASCQRGDKVSWDMMERYNRKDVILTEGVYNLLAPWSKSHPNAGLYTDGEWPVCTVCGSTQIRREGFAYTTVGKYQRFQCKDCGKFLRSRENVANRKALLTNVM